MFMLRLIVTYFSEKQWLQRRIPIQKLRNPARESKNITICFFLMIRHVFLYRNISFYFQKPGIPEIVVKIPSHLLAIHYRGVMAVYSVSVANNRV